MIQLEENNSAEVLKEVGAELAALRLSRGASIRDVSQKLRITPEYIEAIEQGDADAFSSMTYAIGYVRSYSGYLGVSADPFCQRLRDSLSVEQMRPEYEFVENKLSRGRGAGRTAFIAMIMLVSIYGGWYSWDAGLISQDDATPQPGQAVAHNRDPETEMVLRASATSWVEISRPDGSIVSAWLMRQGDEYTIPGDQDIYLTAGNAGGLEIELIGDEPKRLGEWGETISELPLDPTLLNSRY